MLGRNWKAINGREDRLVETSGLSVIQVWTIFLCSEGQVFLAIEFYGRDDVTGGLPGN